MFRKNAAAGPGEVVNAVHLINDAAEFRYVPRSHASAPVPLRRQPQDLWQVAVMKQDAAPLRVK